MLVTLNAEKLHAQRKANGLTQLTLAIRAGISIRYIRDLENGRKQKPSAEYLCKIAAVLEVPMETFLDIQFGEEDEDYEASLIKNTDSKGR